MHLTPDLILATDLDGTFLEGDAELKRAVYNELCQAKDRVMLIYTTGRGIDSVQELCRHGSLPFPHFVIADHGTQIVDGTHFTPITALQDPIIAQWGNANSRIKQLLANDVGIVLQPFRPPYRVAYYYEPNLMQPETTQKISDAGFDLILSCDMYLDILPRGVNKGSSLMRLLQHFGLKNESVVVCGDSLNDLALFQTGLLGVAVGNAEEKLIAEIAHLNNVYLSKLPGLLGVLDGLAFHQKYHLFSSCTD